MSYESNIPAAVEVVITVLHELENPDELLRTVALAVLPELKRRVHVEGKASDGGQIGTYSPGYMALRTGNYSNSGRKAKGKDKGGLKNAGVYSRGDKAGQARPKYNRTADTKVIASLTRQMENDLSVRPTDTGYGIGFNNPHNYDKSQWVQETYKRPIWNLTTEEEELANTVAADFITGKLSP